MDITNRNLWSAFIGEAKANRLYIAYGIKAMEEGHPEVAQVFFEIAGAETVHAIGHLKAVGAMKSTLENLRLVVQEEQYEGQEMYPRFIDQARKDKRPAAVAAFELAMSRENVHMTAFTEALRGLEGKLDRAGALPPAPKAPPSPSAAASAAVSRADAEVSGEKARIVRLERIREIVFGMQDGVVSTMSVAASVMAATGRTAPTLAAAVATGVAGMISMAGGSLLGSQAEKELHEGELKREAIEIAEKPEEEMAELIEVYLREGFTRAQAETMARKIAENAELWLKTMAEKELGISIEATRERDPWKDAATMGASFLLGSALSALPYLVLYGRAVVIASVSFSLALLFLLGYAKGSVTRADPWKSGFQVLAIGLLAALIGYGIGRLVPGAA
ncbi:MAG: VIT1/CCC1 transporter family protein [Elusimicrobia bacterium]|nr:VIT1/CCC1 transporter family protein [Elusimicrobiota bacterium]